MAYVFRNLALLFFSLTCVTEIALGAVEWEMSYPINIEVSPKDAAVSTDGNWIYILTKDGNILIYSSDGQFEDTIHVGSHISFVKAGPSENQLIVGSNKNKTVQILSFEFIQKIDISGASVLGSAEAPVVIVVFMDYQCPYCAQFMPLLERVLENNPQKVKVAYKHYPLKMHKAARSAAAASLVAAQEGRFRELHFLMLDDYKNLTDENILEKASNLGFDRNDFQKKMASPAIQSRIQKDMQDGKQAGISGVPAVFINGILLKSRTLENIQEIIDQELRKVEQ